MLKIKNINVKTLFAITVAIPLLLLIVLSTSAYMQSRKLHKQMEYMYGHPLIVLQATGALKADIYALNRDMKDLSLAIDEKDISVERDWIKWWKEDAAIQIHIIDSLYLGNRDDITQLKQDFDSLISICDKTVDLMMIHGNKDEVYSRTKTFGVIGSSVEKLTAQLEVINDFAINKGDELYEESEKAYISLNEQLILLTVFILLISIIINMVLLRNIIRPLAELTDATKRFHDGNRNARSSYVSKNEFGILSSSFNKLTEEALRMDETNMESIFESSPVPMFVLDEETNIVMVNFSAIKLSGSDESEILHHKLGQALRCVACHEDPRGCGYAKDCELCIFRNTIKGLMSKGGPIHDAEVELEVFRNGKPLKVWQNVGIESLMLKGKRHWCVAMVDITQSKKAEEAIIASNNYLEKIINSVASPIFVKDSKHRFCLVNKALCALLGLPMERIIGTTGYEYLPKEQMDVFISKDEEVFSTGVENISEEFLTDGQGIVRTIITIKTLYTDTVGNTFLVGVINDITELRKANSEVIRLNKDLEKRVKERTRELEQAIIEIESFSFSISHDLQSPLRHINGFAEVLTSDYKENLPEEARNVLDKIINNAKLMGALIDDLLDFSRTNRKELQKTELDMNKMVEATRLQVVRSVDETRLDWNVSSLPIVSGDYSLLFMVWLNLIDNAVKYSKNKEKAIIKVECEETENEYIFSICDNGIGFDMKYAQKLFGVFQRMHSSKVFDGTGIGLANVRNIINRHGGKTWAEAEPDKGATFYFSLPRK